MGCDIHSVAQVKMGGKWHTVLQDVAGDNRNYDTFAILANVRNGSGFAGCDTGDGFEPICERKGLPEDFEMEKETSMGFGGYQTEHTTEYHVIDSNTPSGDDYCWADEAYRKRRQEEKAASVRFWMGDHSYSWHTLEDIEKYLEKVAKYTTKKRGCISLKQYGELKGTGKAPDCYSGWISGQNIVVIPAAEYDQLEAAKDLPKDKDIHIQYEWTVSYTDSTYIDEIVAELTALAEKYRVNHDEVRYVFGFDS